MCRWVAAAPEWQGRGAPGQGPFDQVACLRPEHTTFSLSDRLPGQPVTSIPAGPGQPVRKTKPTGVPVPYKPPGGTAHSQTTAGPCPRPRRG